MKKEQIKIGQVYTAKVSDKLVPVRIEKEHSGGGWDATNLKTNRPVRIKSAQRLRSSLTTHNEPAKSTEVAGKTNKAQSEVVPAPTIEPAAPSKSRTPKAAKPASTKRTGPSLIQAAIQVLGQSKDPMTCTQMVESILQQKLWSSTGKTPAQTLYSSILRELQKKGDEARFTHVAKGQFELNTNAAKKES